MSSDEAFANELMAVLFYDQACDFIKATGIIINNIDSEEWHGLFHVTNVDNLFAIELFLKAILSLYNIPPPYTHSLIYLWNLLPYDVAETVFEGWGTIDFHSYQFGVDFFDDVYMEIRYGTGCVSDEPNTILNAAQLLESICAQLGLANLSNKLRKPE